MVIFLSWLDNVLVDLFILWFSLSFFIIWVNDDEFELVSCSLYFNFLMRKLVSSAYWTTFVILEKSSVNLSSTKPWISLITLALSALSLSGIISVLFGLGGNFWYWLLSILFYIFLSYLLFCFNGKISFLFLKFMLPLNEDGIFPFSSYLYVNF